jgi:hypothetical protein
MTASFHADSHHGSLLIDHQAMDRSFTHEFDAPFTLQGDGKFLG